MGRVGMAKKHIHETENEEIVEGQPVTQDAETWSAIGRKLIEETTTVGREYAKLMIQFSFGAVPVYVSIIGLMLKKETVVPMLGPAAAIWILTPVIGFLLAGIVFVFAYFPRSGTIVLDVIETIQQAHRLSNR